MIIGLRAHDYGKHSPSELFKAISADGWQAAQLAIPKAIEHSESFDDVTEALINDIKSALDGASLTVAVLGVYVDPALTDDARRKVQAGYLKNALWQAKALGAGCVGTETSTRSAEADIRSLYRTLEELLPEAEKMRVNIGIEPVHRHTLHTPELARQMLRDFGSPYLKIIFDPINLLTPDNFYAQEDMWKRCIDCFGEHVIAVHMKGALDSLNEHGMLCEVPFEQSLVDYNALFPHIRNLNAPVLREGVMPSHAKEDIRFLQRIWE